MDDVTDMEKNPLKCSTQKYNEIHQNPKWNREELMNSQTIYTWHEYIMNDIMDNITFIKTNQNKARACSSYECFILRARRLSSNYI